MLWWRKHGKHNDFFHKVYENTGEIPAPLLERPVLVGQARRVADAFEFLLPYRNERGLISLQDIESYSAMHNVKRKDVFVRMISAMNLAWLRS